MYIKKSLTLKKKKKETQKHTTALATQAPFNMCPLPCLPLCCLTPMPTSQLLDWEFFVLPFYWTCFISLPLFDRYSKLMWKRTSGSARWFRRTSACCPSLMMGLIPRTTLKAEGELTLTSKHIHPPTMIQAFSPLTIYTQERN